ncbi:MAG: PqqD family protein [Chloroflexi bacterium]|nr:PqqD family protein [Chloroflexota bacterium]
MRTSTALQDLATWNVTLSKDVLYQELDGDAVLLSVETGEYFGLNTTGAHVWQAVSEGASLTEALDSLSEIFEVDKASVAEDVVMFLRSLSDMGLLKNDAPGS